MPENEQVGTPEAQPVEQAATPTETESTPQPISLTDDSLVTWEGSKEPVPFKTLRGLQAQFTKASQKSARLEREYQEAQRKLAQYEQQQQLLRQSQGQVQPQAQTDPFSKVRSLPYIKGEEAADLMSGVLKDVGAALQQRDKILHLMAQKLAESNKVIQTLQQSHVSSSLESRLKGWMQDLGIDADDYDDVRALYLAYEPTPELDEEFPEILQQWQERQKARIEKALKTKREAAKKLPFVPGKGGRASASAELDLSKKSPKEIAEIMHSTFLSEAT